MNYFLIVICMFIVEFFLFADALNALKNTRLDQYYVAWMTMFTVNILAPIIVHSAWQWWKEIESD